MIPDRLKQLLYAPSLNIGNSIFKLKRGKLPILLVAHIDTVVKDYKDYGIYDEYGVIYTNGNNQLGADDRAGVYAIEAITEYYDTSILLCDGEESGGVGAKAFAKLPWVPNFLNKQKIVIELDRKGSTDWVNYNYSMKPNNTLVKILAGYDFHEAWGTYSDISEFGDLAPNIPMINVSVGFRNEHTKAETLCLRSLGYTIERMKSFIKSYICVGDHSWPNEKESVKYHEYNQTSWYNEERTARKSVWKPSDNSWRYKVR